MNSSHKSQGVRQETIYFNFRLDIGITNLNYMVETVST